ncbi:hypothetical protein [Vibrio fluvialis]|uniref:hypothetical protein n=1 Tax=Vibrio fluvialis TaxID=676 RepID=UPI001F15D735|nr:hypothetical protein [Vibrio fluvialis]MCE7658442.1 hypothetical protein [Vibrio fluvialis]
MSVEVVLEFPNYRRLAASFAVGFVVIRVWQDEAFFSSLGMGEYQPRRSTSGDSFPSASGLVPRSRTRSLFPAGFFWRQIVSLPPSAFPNYRHKKTKHLGLAFLSVSLLALRT